jgi:hypothetical protein
MIAHWGTALKVGFTGRTRGLYWWDPVAWWARREVERAEERSCDAWVLWSLPTAAGA